MVEGETVALQETVQSTDLVDETTSEFVLLIEIDTTSA